MAHLITKSCKSICFAALFCRRPESNFRMRRKYLDDGATYLGNQLQSEIVDGLCFGILANMDFILVCTYEKNGENPELLVYRKR